jgi:hypothetical protein
VWQPSDINEVIRIHSRMGQAVMTLALGDNED